MSAVRDKRELQKEFGRLLAAQRKRVALSQTEFGKLVGLSRASITNLERGRQAVQLHQLYLFASVLEISLLDLLPSLPNAQPNVNLRELEEARYVERLRGLLPAL